MWTWFPPQSGKRLKEYLLVLKSGGCWGHSREQEHPQCETGSTRLSRHSSASAGSWAARPRHFLLSSEFYKAPCVPVSGRGLAECLPVILELEKYRHICAVLPGPVILYALQYLIFVLSAFAPR